MNAAATPVAPAVDDEDVTDGRIPFRLNIGVTGHRRLDDGEAVASAVREALAGVGRLFDRRPRVTPIRYTILSPLAEGADRIVVHGAFAVLGEGITVEAVLPREPWSYTRDFASEASRREFAELLSRSNQRSMPKTEEDVEGYRLAGEYVVDRCDLLIAIWDGEKGEPAGTGDIVEYANDRGTPVLVIDPATAASGELPGIPRIDRAYDAFRQLERHNRAFLDRKRHQRTLADARCHLDERLAESTIRAEVERIAAWSLPHYARAEVRALRFQHIYRLLGDLLYLLAALAVTAVAAQSVFAPERTKLTSIEIGLLLGVVAVFFIARKGRVHDRWTSHRSLAEAFRSGLFIALIGVRDRSDEGVLIDLRDGRDPWFQRAFSEVWATRPPSSLTEADDEALRHFLLTAWVDDQIAYHDATAKRCRRRHTRLTVAVAVLVALALVVATLHFFDVGEGTDWPRWSVFLAIALPGFGAAVTGIREHRQYRLHSRRSERAADRLRRIKARLETGLLDLSPKELAIETHSVISEESVEWTGVQELQDLELVM